MVVGKHPFSNALKTYVDLCLCTKSRIVSLEPATKLLLHLGIEYIAYEKMDPKLLYLTSKGSKTKKPVFDRNNLPSSSNILVMGTPEGFGDFCLQVKCVAMKHRFTDPPAKMIACRAIDILKDYYVQQDDGGAPGLSLTGTFDLVVFALGTKEKNQALATCLAQVVALRKAVRKPTWIYLPTKLLTQCPQDYSEDLDALLEDFLKISLTSSERVSEGASKNNKNASSFTPIG